VVYVSFGCRFLLLAVLLCSAVGKLRSFADFRVATAALVPAARPYAAPLSVAVVGTELAAVVLLAVPATVPAGFAVALALLAAFTVAIGAALRRGTAAPCRCFGRSDRPVGVRHLVRNAGLLLAAAVGSATGPGAGAGADPVGLAVAAATAAVLTALVLSADALADLFTPLERTST
jgi:hypothetical protein